MEKIKFHAWKKKSSLLLKSISELEWIFNVQINISGEHIWIVIISGDDINNVYDCIDSINKYMGLGWKI